MPISMRVRGGDGSELNGAKPLTLAESTRDKAAIAFVTISAFALYLTSALVLQSREATALFGADTGLYVWLAHGNAADRVTRFHPLTTALITGWMHLFAPLGRMDCAGADPQGPVRGRRGARRLGCDVGLLGSRAAPLRTLAWCDLCHVARVLVLRQHRGIQDHLGDTSYPLYCDLLQAARGLDTRARRVPDWSTAACLPERDRRRPSWSSFPSSTRLCERGINLRRDGWIASCMPWSCPARSPSWSSSSTDASPEQVTTRSKHHM